jgi:hypothetical protein
MKIAVLLTGMPRYLDTNKVLMKDFFKGHEVDYFCHAWFDKTKKTEEKSWHKTNINIDPHTEEKIVEIFKPKNYLLEPQRQFELPRNYNYNTGFQQPFFIVYSHFYSVKTANMLRLAYEKETGVKYDVVFKLRYDLFIGNKLRWEQYDLNKLYLHDNCNTWSELYDNVSFNDMIAFSKPENMNVYCDVFDNIDSMYMNNQMRFSCENFVAYQLLSHDIDVVPIYFTRALLLRENNTFDLSVGIRYQMNDLEKLICHNND